MITHRSIVSRISRVVRGREFFLESIFDSGARLLCGAAAWVAGSRRARCCCAWLLRVTLHSVTVRGRPSVTELRKLHQRNC